MIRILTQRNSWIVSVPSAPLLALCLVVTLACPSLVGAVVVDDFSHGQAKTITVFTETLPPYLTTTPLPGLSVSKIERLDALNADLVYVLVEGDLGSAHAMEILVKTFPHAGFELFEDFAVDETALEFTPTQDR